MVHIAGKHALLKMFEAEGVKYMFGNPGTSEAPMMAVMNQYPSIEYVLVLQEGVAVGLAEGYARSTGKVPLVSLHIDNGMSNGLSLMIDQLYGGTPMVMTAGNKDIRKIAPGPLGPSRYGSPVRQMEHRNHTRRASAFGHS
ncbi:MAG: hypothetical protein CM1200mP39_18060 [Dehalococcoidia bacterium]|nr:MAG: hypothetical protein CM1200mP39_18060 [Dehalococcoidia bacterium]